MAEDPHLRDERIGQIKLAFEPDDREKCPTGDVFEKIDIGQLIDKHVDLESSRDADGNPGLRLDNEDGLVLGLVRIHRSSRHLGLIKIEVIRDQNDNPKPFSFISCVINKRLHF
jgi:hypothetical protein